MVRRRKHRSTVPLATAMRKPKRLQEVSRADVRERNPRPRAEPPSDPILDAVSEDAEATTEDTAARSSSTVSSARARTNRSVHRRVFGGNSWIGAFSSKNEILLRLLTVKLRRRLMPEAALGSDEDHRTLPRRLDSRRGRTISSRPRRQPKSAPTPPPRPVKAPRVLALSGHLSEPRRGAPRGEHHGRLQRWLEDATKVSCGRLHAWSFERRDFPKLCSLPNSIL